MNILVLGGYGNFGARICRALAGDNRIALQVAGRDLGKAKSLANELGATACRVDSASPQLARELRDLEVGLVIHTAGPFQVQDYSVAQAEPIQVWREGRWQAEYGWGRPQEVQFARLKPRLGAPCDIPDLELFPMRYAGAQQVMFRAALEVRFTQWLFAALAWLKQRNWLREPARLAGLLHCAGGIFDPLGTPDGAMVVRLAGSGRGGQRLRLAWHITAGSHHRPEIPCMAAILLARRLARGDGPSTGAHTAAGLVSLREFAPEFERWGMVTEMQEERAAQGENS